MEQIKKTLLHTALYCARGLYVFPSLSLHPTLLEEMVKKSIFVNEDLEKPIKMQDFYPKMYLYKRIVQAKLFIDQHFGDHIQLNDIAEEAHFSKFHFIRLFTMTYGKTPHQYLSHVRVEKAKLYLQEGMSVREVCFKVGYDSLSSFSGRFRQHTNCAPSVYQKRFLQRQIALEKVPLKFIPGCFTIQKGWV